jgi:predicted dehydrogenase
MTRSVAFVGTGPDPDNTVGGESFAMAYRHAAGYRTIEDCELEACADLVRENAEAFAEQHDIGEGSVYRDYEAMVADVEPDIVSVCTPVPTHASIVVNLVRSGVVDAVHCEKPMAHTWGDARHMAQQADRFDVQLTFNHQRRFSDPWRRAKELLADGEIGTLERVEMGGSNFFDHGTHYVDLCNFYAGESPVEWVIGQFDYRDEDVRYGVHNENHMLASWKYANGVDGFASTGVGRDVVGAAHRLVGTNGQIEVKPSDAPETPLRIRRAGDPSWERILTDDTNAIHENVRHVVDCLGSDTEPETGARNALSATEVIFAAYESARRRGRVDLPLEVEDHPLESLVDSGDVAPFDPTE